MGTGKKKIEIKKKEKAIDRIVTFSKRKKGLFNKASQLNKLCGSHIGIIVFSPAGRPHTNAPMFDPAISRYLSSIRTAAATDTDTCSGDVGAWLNSVGLGDLLLAGESAGAAPSHDSCEIENLVCIKEWLNNIQVEKMEKVEDLLPIKHRLEIMREKLANKICSSYLA